MTASAAEVFAGDMGMPAIELQEMSDGRYLRAHPTHCRMNLTAQVVVDHGTSITVDVRIINLFALGHSAPYYKYQYVA